jgi:hypothetical protein
MTTSTAVATVPAHIAARIAARQAAGGGKSDAMKAIIGDGASFPKISIRAGRYRLVEDGVETPVGITLDAIIVGVNPKTSKVFYAKAYDQAADGVRPDCFSNDGITPDASVTAPVSKGCAGCHNNVLGSKILPSGAKSKMCGDQRHMAVIAAADPGKVYGMTVPVSGMKALREYFKELDNFGINPEEVITELGFDDAASFPKITFKQKGYVPDKHITSIDKIVAGDEVKVAVRVLPFNAVNRTAIAAPANNAQIAAPVAAPAPAPAPVAPAVDPDYDDTPTPETVAATVTDVKAKPVAAPVKASSELEAKLDNLFGE